MKKVLFVILYLIPLAITYYLSLLGSNSVLYASLNSPHQTDFFIAHISCYIFIILISIWLAGDKKTCIFPIIAGVFDLTPVLNFIPLVPTILNIIGIVYGVLKSKNKYIENKSESSHSVNEKNEKSHDNIRPQNISDSIHDHAKFDDQNEKNIKNEISKERSDINKYDTPRRKKIIFAVFGCIILSIAFGLFISNRYYNLSYKEICDYISGNSSSEKNTGGSNNPTKDRIGKSVPPQADKDKTYQNEKAVETPVKSESPQIDSSRSPGAEGEALSLASLEGTWRGHLTTAYGKTGATLIVKEKQGNPSCVFTFYPLKENPGAGSGQYEMSMSFDNMTMEYILCGVRWLKNPKDRTFMHLRGKREGSVFSGIVFTDIPTQEWAFLLEKSPS